MLAAIALSALGISQLSCDPGGPKFERVVLIVVDTLRRDYVWPYHRNAATPNFQRLAERGQVFDNAFASFHQTTMSMGALFTGRTPSLEAETRDAPLPFNGKTWCGLHRLADSQEESCVPQHLDTLAEDLSSAGYWTIGIASNVFLYQPSGFDQGFDEWVELGGARRGFSKNKRKHYLARQGEFVTAAALEALERRPNDKFFLYVHYMDVHDWWELGRGNYSNGVSVTDEALGQLLDHLEEQGLMEGTLFVLTSDHGELLGRKNRIGKTRTHLGNPTYEEVLEVPLIVAPPTSDDPKLYLRSQDLRAKLHDWLSLPSPVIPQEIAAEEQLLTEAHWQTYRRWPWKSMWRRDSDVVHLFNLQAEASEQRDVAGKHPRVLQLHRKRIADLAAALASTTGTTTELTEADMERLRALGYAE